MHDRLVYTSGSSGPTDDAVGTLLLGAGVCRDYAHLVLSLLREGDVPKNDNGVVAIFDVEDVAQAVAELRAKGVRCTDPITIPQMVTYADIFDPEGNRIQLVNSQPPA